METKESLLELERELWNADEAFYREVLSTDAVMVFPEPTGVLAGTDILESIGTGERWRRIDFSDVRLVEIREGVRQLVYRADAKRSEDGSEYSALITTTYVRTGGDWTLVAHQQTPIDD
jgi:hypothetical protein